MITIYFIYFVFFVSILGAYPAMINFGSVSMGGVLMSILASTAFILFISNPRIKKKAQSLFYFFFFLLPLI